MKMGTKLEDIVDVGGRAEEWSGVPGNEGKVAPPEEAKKEEQAGAAIKDLLDDLVNGDKTRSTYKSDQYVYGA